MAELSAMELAQLRTIAGDYLPDTCSIATVARTSDAMGGWSQKWTNTYTLVPCRLAPARATRDETLRGEQVSAYSQWVLTVAHNQTIDETMRVVHDSETYEVLRLEDTHSSRTAKRAYLVRLD